MNDQELLEIFMHAFKGKNFMTPHAVKYGRGTHYLWELSEGTDFDRKPLYGVTCLNLDGSKTKPSDGISRCFQGPRARQDAERYINTL